MNDDEYSEERYLLERLADLRRAYEREAKPYVDRLVAINNLKPPPPIMMTPDQARAFAALPAIRAQIDAIAQATAKED